MQDISVNNFIFKGMDSLFFCIKNQYQVFFIMIGFAVFLGFLKKLPVLN